MDNIKTLFVDLYGDQLKKPHTTVIECHSFDEYFDQQLRELEKSGVLETDPQQKALSSDNLGDEPPLPPGLTFRGRAVNSGNEETSTDNTPIVTPNTSRPSTPGGSNLVVAKPGPMSKMSRRARKVQNAGSAAPASSGDEAVSRKQKAAKAAKKGRKWDADGMADEDDDVQLDYSAAPNTLTSDSEAEATARSGAVERVDSNTWGTKTKGRFVLKDLDDEVHDILSSAQARSATAKASTGGGGIVGSSLNTISGLFRNVIGGKVLTKEDIDKAMKGMEEHLLRKNVAREAAVRLCEGVEKELMGVKTSSFESRSFLTFAIWGACPPDPPVLATLERNSTNHVAVISTLQQKISSATRSGGFGLSPSQAYPMPLLFIPSSADSPCL